jgi:S1-C subfamily serine protease
MDMPVNSGNSGGPVFDYKGNVIGVVTLKAIKQEAHGFCIPAEEVEDSLKKMKRVKESEVAEMLSNHRVKAVYSVASESSKIYLSVMQFYILQARLAPKGTKVKDIVVPVELRTALKKINQELHDDIQKYFDDVMEDKDAVSDNLREQLKEFWENFQVLKQSAESPDGKLDAYQKKFQEAAKKFAELKPKLKEGLGVEFDH